MSFRIVLNLTEQGLKKFRQVTTFNHLLHSNQIDSLVVGANLLFVNPTVWGSLQRVVSYDSSNMTVKRLTVNEEVISKFKSWEASVDSWCERVIEWRDSEEKDSNIFNKLDEERKQFSETRVLLRRELENLTVKELKTLATIFGEKRKSEVITDVLNSVYSRVTFLGVIYFI